MPETGPTITELWACCAEHDEDVVTVDVGVPRDGMALLVEGLAAGEPYVVLRARDAGALEVVAAILAVCRKMHTLTTCEPAFRRMAAFSAWRAAHPALVLEPVPAPSRKSPLSTARPLAPVQGSDEVVVVVGEES